MDDCDRATISEEQHREAALAALRREREAVRRYRPVQRDTCEECGSTLDPCRRGWTTICVTCANEHERRSQR